MLGGRDRETDKREERDGEEEVEVGGRAVERIVRRSVII